MKGNRPNIAFFGSSLVSAYWNGAATYYRGIIKELHALGYKTTFYEPDAYQRQMHRDIEDPHWAKVVVWPATEDGAQKALNSAAQADVIIKASGVGVFDEFLEKGVLSLKRENNTVIFWDVDAPATIERARNNPQDPFRELIPAYDLIFTYGGGAPVIEAYKALGARECIPVYNALDPATHYPVDPDAKFDCDLGFIANRLPDRESRVREFFFRAAAELPRCRFLLGGNGWDEPRLPNIRYIGHVYTREHNAFNCTPLAVLNVNRDSMARFGYSPPTRIFEAAGSRACIITDNWEGIEMFLEPGKEVLVARNGHEVAEYIKDLNKPLSCRIGEAGYRRIISEHTYGHRARQIDEFFAGSSAGTALRAMNR